MMKGWFSWHEIKEEASPGELSDNLVAFMR